MCTGCGTTFERRERKHGYCSLRCPGAPKKQATAIQRNNRGIDPARTSNRARRQRREQENGLSARQRLKLLHRWQRQGKHCLYCGGSCQAVDHVVPLVRGGTNRIGNLVPSCTTCNSRKGSKLIIEYKAQVRALIDTQRARDVRF